MNAKYLSVGFLACCAWIASVMLVGFIRRAHGEPSGSPARPDETAPERAEATSAPQLDPKLFAEWRVLEAARRKTREKALPYVDAWVANRATRATVHREQIAQVWGNVVGRLDAQPELRLHADRAARLNRMLDLAQKKPDPALITRVQADLQHELARHILAMQAVRAQPGAK